MRQNPLRSELVASHFLSTQPSPIRRCPSQTRPARVLTDHVPTRPTGRTTAKSAFDGSAAAQRLRVLHCYIDLPST
jgi:hypothetical protein